MDIYAEPPKEEKHNKQPPSKASDELTAQMAKEAIQNDEDLAPVADQIDVNVKDGDVSVTGKVNTLKESNKIAATAQALGGNVDKVTNDIKIVKKK